MKPLVKAAFRLAIAAAFASTAIVTNAAAATPAAATKAEPSARAENAFLAQSDAAARSARVANVAYVLNFALTGKEHFSATDQISFDLSDATIPLTIDLDKATITSLTVNGKSLTPQYNQWFITLPANALVTGRNVVTVAYERPHSTNGEGLHSMVDPVDGKVYTYTQFEPAAAHQAFALFDQPDLKATYQLTVTTPADWQVVSTTRETNIEPQGALRRWTFPVTKKLSAYNFSLHAGPYHVWEDKSGKYPMRLFARESVAAQVAPADWFKYTNNGLKFFDTYFGIPYQFEKYDQLLVPDFLYGAMENAGAVTFAENGFLHKAAMTAGQRETLAEVILHEMAHQWFGDLVTMKWWNGVWLNESFASFMATMATAETTEFTNAWQSFYARGKQAAYVADQRVTTHPIEVPVPSTGNAFDNIDAITYSKGASTLAQLRHLLGEEVFRTGVHNYLVKYQFRNARLDDFIGSLGQAAHRDLSAWTRDWLYQPGVNGLAADYTCRNGKIDRFSLKQSAASATLPTLREQRVQVGVFNLAQDQKALKLTRKVAVTYKGATTAVPALVGAACPDLVYPNYEDWGFVKARLDTRSAATARTSLNQVSDPLLRSMLWQSLWDGVRDAELPMNEFVSTVLANAPAEKDYVLLGGILNKVVGVSDYLGEMMPDAAYTKQTAAALEQMTWDAATANASNRDFLRRWLGTYIELASSRAGLDRLAGLLNGKLVIDGLTVDQDLRWAMITQLSRHDYPGTTALIEAEVAKDRSDTGQAAAIGATVSRPDPQLKADWLAKIQDLKTTMPYAKVRVAMQNLFPSEQTGLGEASARQRLAGLAALDKAAGPVFMRGYAAILIPASCTPASVARLQEAIVQNQDLSVGTRRQLLIAHQEDARCVAIKGKMTIPSS